VLRKLNEQGAAVDVPRAMLLFCFQHEEPPMRLPRRSRPALSPFGEALKAGQAAGMEFWQVPASGWVLHSPCL
jgi:hypothetical protein